MSGAKVSQDTSRCPAAVKERVKLVWIDDLRGIGGKGARLAAFGTRGLFCLAFRHDGRAQPSAKVVRQFVKCRIPVNFDGFFGCVAHHVAVVAPSQVILKFGTGAGVNDAVEVVRQLLQKLRAFHFVPSPPLRF